MKKETIFKRWFNKWFFPNDTLQVKLEKGEELWKELSKELPRPVGVLEDDAPRLQYFAARCKDNLSNKEKDCLKLWLEHRLYDLEHNFCEHTTASLEEYENKWKQIYRTHLEVIS